VTIEEVKIELEKIVFDLTSSGFDNIDSGTVEKLEKIAASAGELGMMEGKKLIGNLSRAMEAIKEGKSLAESGALRLIALDFYVKNLPDGNTEDL